MPHASALSPDLDRQAIALLRGLAMDAPLHAKSGHQGTAMALAPLGHVLFSRVMHHDPADPAWPDRDRFILSNGHASILHYGLLFLNGYGLELDDLRAFRSWESKTPGHPEAGYTTGIEVTTGPLGQGFANAVGMAIAERHLQARFGKSVQDHRIFTILGDGCMMEGISHEAASLAGHLRLGSLIAVFDDNHITIDGSTALATGDDVPARFRAYGWEVTELGEIADDCDALERALSAARERDDRPQLLVLRTHIATPSPDLTDHHEAHGNPFTAEQVARTKAVMGIPNEPFWAPPAVVKAIRKHAASAGRELRRQWEKRYRALSKTHKAAWDAAWGEGATAGWAKQLPSWTEGEEVPTRVAVEKTFNALADHLPGLIIGAADLTGNTGTKLAGASKLTADDPGGQQLHYGIREHGMAAAMVGMARHGGVLPVGGTFFVFFDYMKPSVRLAALSHAKVIFVFTHDSVAVGEDGPTHQPIEHLAALRAIPELQVIRPADANETAHAVAAAIRHHGPTALVLSRQSIPVCTDGSAVEPGAGIVVAPRGAQVILAATGSEVALCVQAAATLKERGVRARVVSMPSWDRLAAAGASARRKLFPKGVPVLSVEAGSVYGWSAFADESIGIDQFGSSAPGAEVLRRLGINVDNVVRHALALVRDREPSGTTKSEKAPTKATTRQAGAVAKKPGGTKRTKATKGK